MSKVVAVVLAAGLSSRMGANKLLADLRGKPMLARTLQQVKAAQIHSVYVVTGHMAKEIGALAQSAGTKTVYNPDYKSGMASSVRAGIAACADADAALIMLGDMPLVSTADINRLIAAFGAKVGHDLVVPVRGRKWGNPVLWGRKHFPALMLLEGDRGARKLLQSLRGEALEIECDGEGIFMDADTSEALAKLSEHPKLA